MHSREAVRGEMVVVIMLPPPPHMEQKAQCLHLGGCFSCPGRCCPVVALSGFLSAACVTGEPGAKCCVCSGDSILAHPRGTARGGRMETVFCSSE